MIPLDRVAGAAPVWAPALVVSIAVLVGVSLGLGPALLVVAAGMLVAAISAFWSSLGRLTGESPLTLEEAVGLGAPSPEEERKRSILRALKDLDYERSVGKISDHDYHELSARYREEAKRLIERVDESLTPERQKAEKLLAERVARDKERALERERQAPDEREGATSERGEKDDEDAPPSSERKPTDTDELEKDAAKDAAKKDEEERA